MIIPLKETLRIKGTETCWELQRVRSRRGKQEWESFKWFTTFGRAVDEAVHREIRLHPATTLAEAIEAVSGIVRKYEELIPSSYKLTK